MRADASSESLRDVERREKGENDRNGEILGVMTK